MSVFDILVRYQSDLLHGLGVTVKLFLFIWMLGIAAGVIVGVASFRWHIWIEWPARAMSFLLSGIPVLVLLFWLHYPVQYQLGIIVDPFVTSVVALSLVNASLVSDLVRSVLKEFPDQYVQAARVTGLSARETVLHIQLPIVSRQILPPLLSIQVNMLQATLFASLISVDEIFRVAQRINSEIYRPVEIYTALAIFFLAVCLPLHAIAHILRVRFTRNLSER
jgi:His/Glu/Gln/Arg/opine family amino acid ABC transporter permease subunit